VRIVGGRLGGRPLATPAHEGTRPTSDRVREAIFNILAHGVSDFELERAKVLDLFAGTGALGLEALSRGAAFCLFIENETEARALLRRNIEALGLTGVTKLFRRDATELGLRPRSGGKVARIGSRGRMARTGRHRRGRRTQERTSLAPRRLCRVRSAQLGRHTSAVCPLRSAPELRPTVGLVGARSSGAQWGSRLRSM